jgi:1,2-diacylglycerol 3-alpha-glucosyltransferase
MISTDRKIFEEGSTVRERMKEYGAVFGELHIIVFSTLEDGLRNIEKISKNVFAYPTHSSGKFSRVRDAVKIGRAIISHDVETKGDSTVITCQDPFETGLAGWRLSRKMNTPFQLQVHTDFLSPYFGRESLANSIRVVLASFLLPRSHGIRVVSEKIHHSILERYPRLPSGINVIPIFVDVDKIRSAPITMDVHKKYSRFKKVILMASRLTSEKNIPLALRAFAQVVIKHPDALLLIIGEGPARSALEVLANELQVRSRVVFEPWQKDLSSYYKTADLFLLTSNYEGYGMSLVEATAADCPVITTEVGVSERLLSPDARVSVDDKEALAEKLITMLDIKERRASILRYAREHLHYVISRNKEQNIEALHQSLKKLIG